MESKPHEAGFGEIIWHRWRRQDCQGQTDGFTFFVLDFGDGVWSFFIEGKAHLHKCR